MSGKSTEKLKKAAFQRVAECRRSLQEGGTSLTGLEDSVRAYCEAVAKLPKDEGRTHTADLELLGREVETLSTELTRARDAVQTQINGLSRLKQANVAYHKSDAMGPVYRPKDEDE